MKKKLLVTFLSLACVIECAAGLTACDFANSGEGPVKPDDCANGKHSYKWAYDSERHWQKCKNCGNETESKMHYLNNGECKECGYVKESCTKHNLGVNVYQGISEEPSTCTTAGHSALYICGICYKTYIDENCTEYAGTVSKYEIENGNLLEYCKVFSLLDHTPVKDEAIAATCIEKGKTEGSHCRVCNTVLKAQQETDYADHEYTDTVTVQEITLKQYKICNMCGKMENKEITYRLSLNADENSYTLTGVLPLTVTELNIPNACNGKPITVIGKQAFKGCNALTDITIPDCVISICEAAFSGCDNLIETERGIYYVDRWAIGYNTDSALTYELRNDTIGIANSAFMNCKMLGNITIPDSVKYISYGAFAGSGISRIYIPKSVTNIEYAVFDTCNNLVSIEVENGNTKYHSKNNCLIETANKILISGCQNSIIPADGSVTVIGQEAFFNCQNLKSITIPNGVTSIERLAFTACRGLKSLIIPNSVISIDTSAFNLCSGLTSVIIGNGLTSIGWGIFKDCELLTSINIPDSVTSIGKSAFYNCRSLTSISFNGTMAQWNAIEKDDDWNLDTGNYTIHCTDGDIVKES